MERIVLTLIITLSLLSCQEEEELFNCECTKTYYEIITNSDTDSQTSSIHTVGEWQIGCTDEEYEIFINEQVFYNIKCNK